MGVGAGRGGGGASCPVRGRAAGSGRSGRERAEKCVRMQGRSGLAQTGVGSRGRGAQRRACQLLPLPKGGAP